MNENEDVGLNDCFTIPRERGVSVQREVSVQRGVSLERWVSVQEVSIQGEGERMETPL